jgi:hypothetical protein
MISPHLPQIWDLDIKDIVIDFLVDNPAAVP